MVAVIIHCGVSNGNLTTLYALEMENILKCTVSLHTTCDLLLLIFYIAAALCVYGDRAYDSLGSSIRNTKRFHSW